jgi:hypothetical protein
MLRGRFNIFLGGPCIGFKIASAAIQNYKFDIAANGWMVLDILSQ